MDRKQFNIKFSPILLLWLGTLVIATWPLSSTTEWDHENKQIIRINNIVCRLRVYIFPNLDVARSLPRCKKKKHVCDFSSPKTPHVGVMSTWFQYLPVVGSNETGIPLFGFCPTVLAYTGFDKIVDNTFECYSI